MSLNLPNTLNLQTIIKTNVSQLFKKWSVIIKGPRICYTWSTYQVWNWLSSNKHLAYIISTLYIFDESFMRHVFFFMKTKNPLIFFHVSVEQVLQQNVFHVYQMISLDLEWIHWSQWTWLSGDATNSLVH
jgi:hypothetical protein